jgi:hypothetical protein
MRDMRTPGISWSQACSDDVPHLGAPAMKRLGQTGIAIPMVE